MSNKWNIFTAALGNLATKRARAFRTFMRRTMALAALADPRTGGNETLIHNWGNDEARRIWSDGWKRWRSYSAECDRRSTALWLDVRATA